MRKRLLICTDIQNASSFIAFAKATGGGEVNQHLLSKIPLDAKLDNITLHTLTDVKDSGLRGMLGTLIALRRERFCEALMMNPGFKWLLITIIIGAEKIFCWDKEENRYIPWLKAHLFYLKDRISILLNPVKVKLEALYQSLLFFFEHLRALIGLLVSGVSQGIKYIIGKSTELFIISVKWLSYKVGRVKWYVYLGLRHFRHQAPKFLYKILAVPVALLLLFISSIYLVLKKKITGGKYKITFQEENIGQKNQGKDQL